MDLAIERAGLRFHLDERAGAWGVESKQFPGLFLDEVQVGCRFHYGRRAYDSRPGAGQPETVRLEQEDSPHGSLQRCSLTWQTNEHGLCCSVEFAVPADQPFLLWKFKVENQGQQKLVLERLDFLRLDETDGISAVAPHTPVVFCNGWQSWSLTQAYLPPERMRFTRLGPFRAPTETGFTGAIRPGCYLSHMFGVLADRKARRGLLAGFLSQQKNFGYFQACLHPGQNELHLWAGCDSAHLLPGAQFETDWAYLSFLSIDDPDVLGSYLEAVARQHDLRPPSQPSPAGWCSWYQFSSDGYLGTVTATDIEHNLQAVVGLKPNLPLDVIQIDDGFETKVGDWSSIQPTFPGGMAPLAKEIRTAGCTPGIWLAPYIVHPGSVLAADHPDWILTNRFHKPVNAGFLWDSFATALDITHPDALAYSTEVVRQAVHTWGFPYVKLDFLYAAALPGRYHDPTRTRAQVLRLGLENLRAAAGMDAFLVGCGCPLGPATGLVDAMRIGTDTAAHWYPSFRGVQAYFKQEPNLPSAYNACQNAITRSSLHHRWWINDPDCLLLRPGTELSLAEVQTVATVIAITGGSLLLSDHLPHLPAERLRIAQSLLPLIGQRPQVLDLFDEPVPCRLRLDLKNATGDWRLLAVFNWSDQPEEISLCPAEEGYPGTVNVREFWRGISATLLEGEEIALPVSPHGVLLFSLRSVKPGECSYVGGNLHISQGLEIVNWEPEPGILHLSLSRPGQEEGQVEIYIPGKPRQAHLDGIPIPWHVGKRRYRFPVHLSHQAELVIHFDQDNA